MSYWGGQPCNGQVSIIYDAAASNGLTDDAWVDFQTPGRRLCRAARDVHRLRRLHEPRLDAPGETTGVDFPLLCALMVHEFGHFFGYPDRLTDPPTSITYPLVGPANEAVAPCVALYQLADQWWGAN